MSVCLCLWYKRTLRHGRSQTAYVMQLLGSGPSMLQACRSNKVFGNSNSNTAIPCRVLTPCRPESLSRCVVIAAAQTGVKSLVKKHGSVSVQGTSRKRNEDRVDLQACAGKLTGVVHALTHLDSFTQQFVCRLMMRLTRESH